MARQMSRQYFVHIDGVPSDDDFSNAQRALDYAESISREGVNVTVSDEGGRVFATFCKHGGMRDSTMGPLLCCEDEVIA